MIVFTNNGNLFMDTNKIKIIIEVIIAIMVYYFFSNIYLVNHLLLIALIAMGVSRFNYFYDLNSWIIVCEIVIIILFVGALEKVIFNQNFVIDSSFLKEVIFWLAVLSKAIAIKPLRVKVRNLLFGLR